MNASTILALPPEVLATIPGAKPPAGVAALSDHPASRGYVLITVNTILAFIMTTCFFIRVYTRLIIQRKVSWSDFLLLAGYLFAVVVYISMMLMVSYSGTIGIHRWDLSLLDLLSNRGLVPFYINIVFTNPTFGFVKLSIFILYLEMFVGLRWMRICVYIGATISSAFYLAMTILIFYLTTPVGGEAFKVKAVSPDYLTLKRLAIPTASFGLAIDINLFILPLIAVSHLRIPTKQKILVMIGFGVGLLACLGSFLSFVYRFINLQSDDTSWNGVGVLITAMLEFACGIMICCFPALLLFFRTYKKKFSKAGGTKPAWLCCTRRRKSDITTKDSQYSSYPSERTPAEDKNLYPGLDFLTRPEDIERGDLEKRMENRIGLNAIAL